MIGPGLTCTMRPSTSKSWSFRRSVSALSCSSSRVRLSSDARRHLEQADRRQLEGLRRRPAEVEGLLPGEPLLGQAPARPRGLHDHRRRRDLDGSTGAIAARGAARGRTTAAPVDCGRRGGAASFVSRAAVTRTTRRVRHLRHAEHADRHRGEQQRARCRRGRSPRGAGRSVSISRRAPPRRCRRVAGDASWPA